MDLHPGPLALASVHNRQAVLHSDVSGVIRNFRHIEKFYSAFILDLCNGFHFDLCFTASKSMFGNRFS